MLCAHIAREEGPMQGICWGLVQCAVQLHSTTTSHKPPPLALQAAIWISTGVLEAAT